MTDLVQLRAEGLYCPRGDFYIDPSRPVPRAVITHAHGDHARTGSGRYWCAAPGLGLMRVRLGRGASIEPQPYGAAFTLGGTRVSLHPAGHILGSAQLRIECDGQVWVVSGDYKRQPDPSCAPFEVVACDCFVTEATFAQPQFAWPEPAHVAQQMLDWWRASRDAGRSAVLFCYALGKAQRVLAELQQLRPAVDAAGLDPVVLLHGTMSALVQCYRQAGIAMLPTAPVGAPPRGSAFPGRLILAPPGARGTPWLQRFAPYATAFASGWMGLADAPASPRYEQGFVLSDHADWNALLSTIRQTGARRVLAMHGDSRLLLETLRAEGIDAAALG